MIPPSSKKKAKEELVGHGAQDNDPTVVGRCAYFGIEKTGVKPALNQVEEEEEVFHFHCDGCGIEIIAGATRYHCSTCFDVDFCQHCFSIEPLHTLNGNQHELRPS